MAEAENVPLTKRIVALPWASVAGAKFRVQLPFVGMIIWNSVNVAPDPTNPMAIGFKPPVALKNVGLETPISVLAL